MTNVDLELNKASERIEKILDKQEREPVSFRNTDDDGALAENGNSKKNPPPLAAKKKETAIDSTDAAYTTACDEAEELVSDFLAANVAAGRSIEKKMENESSSPSRIIAGHHRAAASPDLEAQGMVEDGSTLVVGVGSRQENVQPGAFGAAPGTTLEPRAEDWVLTPTTADPSPPVPQPPPLMEADPLEDEEHGQAMPVDKEFVAFKEESKKRERNLIKIFICFAIVCLPAVFVVAFLAGESKGSNGGSTQAAASNTPPTPAPTTQEPSTAPTGYLDWLMEDLMEGLPMAYTDRIKKGGSDTPQWKAWEWFSGEYQNASNLPGWRKKQIYALATVFYSLDGDKWVKLKRENWMDPEKDECYWFSSQFGFINDEGVYMHRIDGDGKLPCNQEGQYQVLSLENVLDAATYDPTTRPEKVRLPPEISLLSNLTKLDFNNNDLNYTQTVTNFLPSELYQMTNLLNMKLSGSEMNGQLPSEMGLLTSLTHLNLIGIQFTGTIPTNLYSLTQMKDIRLSDSLFSGGIPSEIARMSNLHTLMINTMATLSGTIPTELGLLTSMKKLRLLKSPLLHGPIPSQMGLLTNMKTMQLMKNGLTGVLPSELGLIDPFAQNWMYSNNFTGLLPAEICHWGCLDKTSPFPHGGYFLGPSTQVSYDNCQCELSNTYPLPNTTYEISINAQFDLYPWDLEWQLLRLDHRPGNGTEWVEMASYSFVDKDAPAYQLVSEKQILSQNALYHFIGTDSWGNGGQNGGGLSITNGTRIGDVNGPKGTIVWSSYDGVFNEMTETYVWVDGNGHVSSVSKQEGLDVALSSFGL